MTTPALTRRYLVPDISCDHCKTAIENEVQAVDGVSAAVVDIEATSVTVVGGDDAAVRAAIDEAGYDIDDAVEVPQGSDDTAR